MNRRISSVLVTGGCGFIGTHLCRALAESGHKVRVLDRNPPASPLPGVDYTRGDIGDAYLLDKLVQKTEAVYHLAAEGNVLFCEKHPVESYRVNVMGTIALLEALARESKRGPAPKLIFASSSAIYGATGKNGDNLREARWAAWPLSLYAAQKLAAEQATYHFRHEAKIPAVILRLFNVYGEGQPLDSPYSGVITRFTAAILAGNPLELHGGGRQTRDFVAVADVVRAGLLAGSLPLRRCDASPINIGSGKAVSIRALAQMMLDIAGRKVPVLMTPARSGDIPGSCADTSRARRILGWRAQIDLESGIAGLGLPGSLPKAA